MKNEDQTAEKVLNKLTLDVTVIIEPCKADCTLICCDEHTSYGSSGEHSLFKEGNTVSCRICKRKYKVSNIRADLEEVK